MIDLTPAAGVAGRAAAMTLTRLLLETGTVATDFFGLAAMALIWRNETDAAVAVLVVVPVHKCTYPQTGLLHVLEGSPGVVRPVFHSAELSGDNEVGRSAPSSLAGWVSVGVFGAYARGPGDAGTTDKPPTQPVHGKTPQRRASQCAVPAGLREISSKRWRPSPAGVPDWTHWRGFGRRSWCRCCNEHQR
jgi:hypothetical protein